MPDEQPRSTEQTPADKTLEEQLSECKTKCDEYLAGWQRERADFSNYKKDEMRRLAETRDAITENLVNDILPVLDSFDIAFDFLPQEPSVVKWAKGMEHVRVQLLDILKRMGVDAVKVEEGKTMFDPSMHDAVEEVESDKPEGTIVEVMQKGYAMDGKVIRPARVKVGKVRIKNNE